MATATLIVQLSGTSVNAFKSTFSWATESQIEQVYKIKNTSGAQTIDIGETSNIQTMIFKSDNVFKLEFTISGSTVVFPTTYFVINPDSTLFDDLTNINISTDSTTDIFVDVRVYGKVISTP